MTILLILAALLMPVLNRMLGHARRVVCVSIMHQLAVASLALLPDHGGAFVSADDGGWVGGDNRLDAITKYQLYPCTGDPRFYRCPSDPWKHVRTYSINGYLNGECRDRGAKRLSDLKRPDSTFVFIEEHDERGANMNSFLADSKPWPDVWTDVPGIWHFTGINLTFAAGHLECWTWQDPRTLLLDGGHDVSQPQNPDLRRLGTALGAPR